MLKKLALGAVCVVAFAATATAQDAKTVIANAQAALGNQRRTCGLYHPMFVRGARLEHRRTAIPLPGGAEAGDGFRHHRLLQGRELSTDGG